MKTVTLDPKRAAALSRRRQASALIHTIPGGDHVLSAAAAAELERRSLLPSGTAGRAAPVEPASLQGARARLAVGWSTVVGAPLPSDVEDEALLWLMARPDQELEYMGRGRFIGKMPGESIYLDRPGGRRSYAFRVAKRGAVHERGRKLDEDFRARAAWMNDPEARLVVSIGGGGYRLFAAVAAVKAIEQMLGGDRQKIAEVWGSSGGALLGYALSRGHALSAIDRLGFGLYSGERKDLPGLHLRSLLHFATQVAKDWRRGEAGSPELGAWVGAIDELSTPTAGAPNLPFFSLVSNAQRRYPIAFAEREHIPDYCRDFLVPCAARDATAASMAVPFLFRPLRGVAPEVTHGEAPLSDDHWFDGSVVEENPILLPFVKWLRDRRHAPETTPRKLKIALVNLNLRLSESNLVSGLLGGGRLAGRAFDLLDLLLDSKTQAHIRALTEVDGVEIMTATLNLGRMSFITRRNIPHTIRSGQIIEAWKLDLFRGSR
ncbi:MAG: patatin-like phospholipase family protein [Kofleriaceae bacterium]